MKALFYLLLPVLLLTGCKAKEPAFDETARVLHNQVLADAEWALGQQPVTITAFQCDRSTGGIHDFYSEGDYWWPNPDDPDGPYIRRDGESNPGNFVEHRLAVTRFSRIIGNLTSAYLITGDEKYIEHAFLHINAWFRDPATRMNPTLPYAQAIHGVSQGRGIGIIDTIQLMEVAQSILRMQGAPSIDPADLAAAKAWFAEYVHWLRTHPNGIDEMNTQNNHAVCWAMQVASFAKLTGDEETMEFCRDRFKNIFLPDQMAPDGSFPREMERTKPYGYSLFVLDAMAAICQILTTPADNLWTYTTPDGKNMSKGVAFIYPYIADKGSWPYAQDVMYWDEWPVAHPVLLFASFAYGNTNYFQLWEHLPHVIAAGEVERNLPLRNPLIWIDK